MFLGSPDRISGAVTIMSSNCCSLSSVVVDNGVGFGPTVQMACLIGIWILGVDFYNKGGEVRCSDVAGGGELRLQSVHHDHQLLHFRHDPALFARGWIGRVVITRIVLADC